MPAAHPCRNLRQIDSTLRGYLHEEEALGFFTFIRLDLSKEGIKRFVRYAARGGDQMLVLSEFVDVSEILLSQVSGERTPLHAAPRHQPSPQCCPPYGASSNTIHVRTAPL